MPKIEVVRVEVVKPPVEKFVVEFSVTEARELLVVYPRKDSFAHGAIPIMGPVWSVMKEALG